MVDGLRGEGQCLLTMRKRAVIARGIPHVVKIGVPAILQSNPVQTAVVSTNAKICLINHPHSHLMGQYAELPPRGGRIKPLLPQAEKPSKRPKSYPPPLPEDLPEMEEPAEEPSEDAPPPTTSTIVMRTLMMSLITRMRLRRKSSLNP